MRIFGEKFHVRVARNMSFAAVTYYFIIYALPCIFDDVDGGSRSS